MEKQGRSIALRGAWVILLVCGILVAGCGYADKQPSYLAPIPNHPNCFELITVGSLGPFQPKERIRAIRVVEREDLYTDTEKVCWEVVANDPVPARGFTGTVGEVPNGFRQTVPAPPETFTPIPGTGHYYLAVSFAHPQAMPWVHTEWCAGGN